MAASLLKPEQIREIYNNPQNLVDDIQLKPTERPPPTSYILLYHQLPDLRSMLTRLDLQEVDTCRKPAQVQPVHSLF